MDNYEIENKKLKKQLLQKEKELKRALNAHKKEIKKITKQNIGKYKSIGVQTDTIIFFKNDVSLGTEKVEMKIKSRAISVMEKPIHLTIEQGILRKNIKSRKNIRINSFIELDIAIKHVGKFQLSINDDMKIRYNKKSRDSVLFINDNKYQITLTKNTNLKIKREDINYVVYINDIKMETLDTFQPLDLNDIFSTTLIGIIYT